MVADVVDHLAGLVVGATVLWALERAQGRRIGRIGIGAGGREDAGGEAGVVAAAVLGVEHEHHVQEHGLLAREALLAAKHVQNRLCHGIGLLGGRHAQALARDGGHGCLVGDGGHTRPAAEQGQGHIHLVGGARVIGGLVEGVEQHGGALQHVHDGVAVGDAREDVQVALGQLSTRADTGLEVVELGLVGQPSRHEQVGHLLVAEAVLAMGAGHEVGDAVAAVEKVARIGHHLAVHLVVAVDIGDGGEANEHTRAVGVAQAALHVILAVELVGNRVLGEHALVELVGLGRKSQAHGGHGIGVGDVAQGRGVGAGEEAPARALDGRVSHGRPPSSALKAVHVFEDVLALHLDLDVQLVGEVLELSLDAGEVDLALPQIHEHGHREDALQDRLGDVEDIGIALGEHARDGGNDAGPVGAQHGDDRAIVHDASFLCLSNRPIVCEGPAGSCRTGPIETYGKEEGKGGRV